MTIEIAEVQTSATATLRKTLDSMVKFHKRFMHHKDDSTHDLAVLWAAHTYGLSLWRNTPRLYVTAPEPACGKSTQSDLLAFFTPNKAQAASMTGPALFSVMEQSQPVVFLDEADKTFNNSWGRDNVLASVINQGYSRGGMVVRMRKNLPTNFKCYGAMAIIGIDNGCLPADTQTRCIPVVMHKGIPAEEFDEFDHEDFQQRVHDTLTAQAQFWNKDVLMPEWLTGRDKQIWRPLFAVAHAAGQGWYERCERAAQVHQWHQQISPQRATLVAVKEFFDDKAESKVMASALTAWVTEYHEAGVSSPKMLAQRLNGYGVKPKRMREGSVYLREDFVPVWEAWLA